MIITRNGSLIPSVFLGSAGHVMKFVDTFVPMISSTDDWMSWSVSRLMCPFRISFSQICSGLLLSQLRLTRSSTGSTGTPTGTCS
jgi:hypothetical protein